MQSRAAYHLETGVPRRVFGARQRIQRETHTLVVTHTEGETAAGAPHQLWVKDLRRGRLSIYGGLLRFIDLLHRKGVSLETALMIPAWLESYIREVWSAPAPSPKAVPLQLMRSGEHEQAA